MAVSTLAIFNYQKLSSSVVASTMYALRTNDQARSELGDEVYFASVVPYVWGTIDQFHGRIDVSFKVKGTKQEGMMRFRSTRPTRNAFFETDEWSLTFDNGRVVQLLDNGRPDPFAEIDLETED